MKNIYDKIGFSFIFIFDVSLISTIISFCYDYNLLGLILTSLTILSFVGICYCLDHSSPLNKEEENLSKMTYDEFAGY